MKNNLITKSIALLMGVIILGGCTKSFLDVNPNGVLDEATLSSEKA